MIRHFFVKQNLLHDLELQLLKAEAIREFMQVKLQAETQKIKNLGFIDIDQLRTEYGVIKKELKEKLAPYDNGKPFPAGLREELQPKEDQRKEFEAIIDRYDKFEDNIKEKDELIAETAFYMQKVKSDGDGWLQSAWDNVLVRYGKED